MWDLEAGRACSTGDGQARRRRLQFFADKIFLMASARSSARRHVPVYLQVDNTARTALAAARAHAAVPRRGRQEYRSAYRLRGHRSEPRRDGQLHPHLLVNITNDVVGDTSYREHMAPSVFRGGGASTWW